MLQERATFEDGGSGVEAGEIGILDRMQTGRFKVFRHLTDWFSEKRHYHRKDGKIVKERDDLPRATRALRVLLGNTAYIGSFHTERVAQFSFRPPAV